jgi:hypothetical protein
MLHGLGYYQGITPWNQGLGCNAPTARVLRDVTIEVKVQNYETLSPTLQAVGPPIVQALTTCGHFTQQNACPWG